MSLSAALHQQIKAATRERLAAFMMRYFGKNPDELEEWTTEEMRKDVMNFFVTEKMADAESEYTF